MESREHQEWRGQQNISSGAVIKAGIAVGVALFIFSGGTPWSTAGTANAAMGRMLPMPYFVILLIHLLLALGYMAGIAACIHRFRLFTAIITGVGVSIALYAINRLVFTMFDYAPAPDEKRVILVHLAFGLFSSCAYMALSTPPPLENAADEPRDEMGKI